MSLADRIIGWAIARAGQPRIIWDGPGKSRYLSRYYLRGKPRMPDGSDPFDQFGDPKPESEVPAQRWSLFLHCFHRSDADRELHNHPWAWAVSLVLRGGYVEERRQPDNSVRKRRVKPWRLNFITNKTFHRVDLIESDAWTLFLVGPKRGSWGFWCRRTMSFTPWREFLASIRGGTQ